MNLSARISVTVSDLNQSLGEIPFPHPPPHQGHLVAVKDDALNAQNAIMNKIAAGGYTASLGVIAVHRAAKDAEEKALEQVAKKAKLDELMSVALAGVQKGLL